MKIRIPKLTTEHFFGIFLAIYWGQNIIFSYFRAIFQRIPYIKYFSNYIVPYMMMICLVLAVPYFIKVLRPSDIFFAGAVTVIVLLNIIIYPENESLTALVGSFFTSVFPLYFIGLRFESSKHFRILYIMSIVNIWAFAAYYLLIDGFTFSSAQAVSDSFMGRAYTLLPQILVTVYWALKRKNVLNIITSIFGFVMLLMCGNRGSVVILLLFILIYIMFNTRGKNRFYLSAGALSIFAILTYFYNKLIVFIVSLFTKYGINVRIFERIASGTFFESSGRELILEKLKVAIFENPFIGYGLCSDRTISGSYAHNYAVELWTAFGVVFGSIILVITLYVIVKALVKLRNSPNGGLLLILICAGFIKLFISSSFLLEGMFFMLIGYCVSQLRKSKFEVIEFGENKNEDM